jgi:hypothetical protein
LCRCITRSRQRKAGGERGTRYQKLAEITPAFHFAHPQDQLSVI